MVGNGLGVGGAGHRCPGRSDAQFLGKEKNNSEPTSNSRGGGRQREKAEDIAKLHREKAGKEVGTIDCAG